jgi:uncharacterized repeat protein (TIGR02543 family)
MNMKRKPIRIVRRVLTAVLMATLLMSIGFAGASSPDTVFVASADELAAALASATTSGRPTILYYAPGTSEIDVSGSLSIPSNVTLDLSTTGGTLKVNGGGELSVSGIISGGAVEVAGGTLIRQFGSSITATIAKSASGVVRGARVLTRVNFDPASSETVIAIRYAREPGADTSAYVTRAATGILYVKMTGPNYSSYQNIESVSTSAGNVFRLGSKYTDTLSLAYALTYGGLTGASLTVLNPSTYTASDIAIPLNNPTKEGFIFAGWTCDALGVTVPQEKMVIPEGTTGALTFIAMWVEAPAGGGMSGGLSGKSSSTPTPTTTDDAAAQQDAAAKQDQPENTGAQSTRHTKTASSSTKVSFSDQTDATVPSVALLRQKSFPWGWMFGGLAGLGVIAYVAAKLVNRKRG